MNATNAKRQPTLLALAILMVSLLWSCSSVAHAGESASGKLFLRMQTETTDRVVNYCSSSAPQTSVELAVEYEAFKRKVANAAAPLLAKMQVEVAPLEAANIDSFITEIGNLQFEAVKKYEPSGYCRWLIQKMRSTTTVELASTMKAQFDRYTELAGQKSRPH